MFVLYTVVLLTVLCKGHFALKSSKNQKEFHVVPNVEKYDALITNFVNRYRYIRPLAEAYPIGINIESVVYHNMMYGGPDAYPDLINFGLTSKYLENYVFIDSIAISTLIRNVKSISEPSYKNFSEEDWLLFPSKLEFSVSAIKSSIHSMLPIVQDIIKVHTNYWIQSNKTLKPIDYRIKHFASLKASLDQIKEIELDNYKHCFLSSFSEQLEGIIVVVEEISLYMAELDKNLTTALNFIHNMDLGAMAMKIESAREEKLELIMDTYETLNTSCASWRNMNNVILEQLKRFTSPVILPNMSEMKDLVPKSVAHCRENLAIQQGLKAKLTQLQEKERDQRLEKEEYDKNFEDLVFNIILCSIFVESIILVVTTVMKRKKRQRYKGYQSINN